MKTDLQRFHDLDAEWKQMYVAFYPTLSNKQRREFLEGEHHPYALLRKWNKDVRWFREEELPSGASAIRWVAPRAAYTLRSLEIRTDRGSPILRGTGFVATAILHYEDGREADVSQDVHWSVSPSPRVRIEKGRVEFGCIHEEVSVSAEFLDERKQILPIPVLKPLKSFKISLEDRAQDFRGDGYLELTANAVCEDGSQERVSCQANWTTTREIGEIVGCGQFRLLDAQGKLWGVETVRAHYGDREAQLRLDAPKIMPGGRKTAPTVSR